MSIKRSISLILALILCFSLAACGSGDANENGEDTAPDSITVSEITVKVVSDSSKPISGASLSVFGDADKKDSVAQGFTDSEGCLKITAVTRDSYYVFIDEPIPGYKTEAYYRLKGEDSLVITLEGGLVDPEDAAGMTFSLGDLFFDFEVKDHSGKVCKLSSLLREKKAVVLNFWFFGCQPCMNEFPHLQEAYSANDGSVEVIAINYIDGDMDWIESLAQTGGLTFPILKDDSPWNTMLNINAAPTTVVIDNTGTLVFKHVGGMTTEEFTAVFDYFTSDSYDHTPVRNLTDITE